MLDTAATTVPVLQICRHDELLYMSSFDSTNVVIRMDPAAERSTVAKLLDGYTNFDP